MQRLLSDDRIAKRHDRLALDKLHVLPWQPIRGILIRQFGRHVYQRRCSCRLIQPDHFPGHARHQIRCPAPIERLPSVGERFGDVDAELAIGRVGVARRGGGFKVGVDCFVAGSASALYNRHRTEDAAAIAAPVPAPRSAAPPAVSNGTCCIVDVCRSGPNFWHVPFNQTRRSILRKFYIRHVMKMHAIYSLV